MPQNTNRLPFDEKIIGREVISSLEGTLEWMKSQFDGFRSEILWEKGTAPAVSTATGNSITQS